MNYAVMQDPKICFSDDTLPDGYNVKKGDMVVYLPYAMGRMKFLWGDDADAFRPERWLDDAGTFLPENPFKFAVFQVMKVTANVSKNHFKGRIDKFRYPSEP